MPKGGLWVAENIATGQIWVIEIYGDRMIVPRGFVAASKLSRKPPEDQYMRPGYSTISLEEVEGQYNLYTLGEWWMLHGR